MMPMQVQRQDLPLADSCLTKVTSFLNEKSDHFSALSCWVNDELEYRSVCDALIAAFLPHMVQDIVAFYDGDGPNLRGIYSQRFIAKLDAVLLRFLKHSYQLFCDERSMRLLFPHLTKENEA